MPVTHTMPMPRFLSFLAAVVMTATCLDVARAQEAEGQGADPQTTIEAAPGELADQTIQQRIESIYQQIDELASVEVLVQEGVVTLSGTVSNEAQAQRALELANRLEGSVTVEDEIERVLDVEGNVVPILEQLRSDLTLWLRALPLVLLSTLVFLFIAYAGNRLANWQSLWQRVAPNTFLAELVAQAIKIVAIIVGLVVALNLMGATTLMGTILGGAGVLGLTIGFAVRDTMENYISSIMLSLRQPFRANDHVVINEHEGKVVRLTSRATVLMSLDGNHLRIPNSTVYKAVILNYTRNPERRFEFDLGVDANDDPIAAMNTGLEAICALEHVLAEPKPDALIKTVGDSNIIITFMAWMNQEQSDFGKIRSLAIQVAKNALEAAGFTLPEPIYRVRLDEKARPADDGSKAARPPAGAEKNTRVAPGSEELLDVSPDTRLEEMVNDERSQSGDTDLLDHARPVE